MAQVCVHQAAVAALTPDDQERIRTVNDTIYLGQPAIYTDETGTPWCVWDDDRIDCDFWLGLAAANGLADVTRCYAGLPDEWVPAGA